MKDNLAWNDMCHNILSNAIENTLSYFYEEISKDNCDVFEEINEDNIDKVFDIIVEYHMTKFICKANILNILINSQTRSFLMQNDHYFVLVHSKQTIKFMNSMAKYNNDISDNDCINIGFESNDHFSEYDFFDDVFGFEKHQMYKKYKIYAKLICIY